MASVAERSAGPLGFLLAAVAAAAPAAYSMNHNVVLRTPRDAARARAAGLKALPFAEGLFRTQGAPAVLETQEYEAPGPFDDLVASLSAVVPAGGEAELSAKVRSGGAWSDWHPLGVKRSDGWTSPPKADGDGFGEVDVDALKLKRPADAFRLRVRLKPGRRPVRLLQAAVALSGPEVPPAPPPFSGGAAARDLGLEPLSQREAQTQYSRDICSPTSLAMILKFWGKEAEPEALALEVRDRGSQLFGNWPANAAAAADRGLAARVARLDSLADLEREIAAGRPVVASVAYEEGDLPGSPIKRTAGHLLVVGGFTSEGDVVAYDPAGPTRAEVRRIYGREAFHKAWRARKRGLAYLIGPDLPRRLTVGVPTADLWSRPVRRAAPRLDDAAHLTQLLYGEAVQVLEARRDWVRVAALEQESFLPAGAWQGYPGWMRSEDLVSFEPPASDAVVRTRQALLQRGEEIVALSVGTRLARAGERPGAALVRLLDGGTGELPPDALYAPPAEPSEASRAEIIRTAELFLGTSYYWGGRSGAQPDPKIGVDCSGLVSLAYRIHGRDVPRDSHEQKLRSRPVRRAELKGGDLVFLTDGEASDRVTHVMIYTGGDGLIESRKSSGRVLRSTFLERFGSPLASIESGDALTDFSFPRPRRRRIFFGSYF